MSWTIKAVPVGRCCAVAAVASIALAAASATATASLTARASGGQTWAQVTKFVRDNLPRFAKEHKQLGLLVESTFDSLTNGDQALCQSIVDNAPALDDEWAVEVPRWQEQASTMSTDGKNYDKILRTINSRLDIAPRAVPKTKRSEFTAAVKDLELAAKGGTSGAHPKEFFELSAAYSDLASHNCGQSVTDSDSARTDGTTAWAREWKGLTKLAKVFGVHVTIPYAPPAPYA